MNRYPIVFIHRGGDSYLGASLTQARVSNPDAEVYLIGDRFNRGFSGVIHLEWQDYARTAREFAKGYQHRETAEYERVLFWFQRWFILNEALRALQLPGCLYLDSDVLLY